MTGILWFLYWQCLGLRLADRAFRPQRRPVRLWLGSCMGSILSMWAPVPPAFLWGFGAPAHMFAAAAGAAVLVAAEIALRKKPASPPSPSAGEDPDRPLWILLPVFLLLSITLLLSHTLRDVNGSLYTGQCTYGDMSMHLGFITSLAVQRTFPPYYSILPTARICYPFLCDSVSASLYLLGTDLRWAYMIPMFFAFAQVFAGFWFLAREICREKGAPVLAFLFFFLNGGLGMIYFRDKNALRELFTGFYKTPTNLTEKGMRWVNVIADMLLPQRATLFGWAALLCCLFLLFRAVFRDDERLWLPAGILSGALPMIHTHSYLSMGLIAACWMVWSARRDGFSRRWWKGWLLFGLPAVALAVPQLLIWTFRSVGGNEGFLRLNFDWVNGGQENWFWFWLKNVGPVFLFTPVAWAFASREQRAIFSGAILIFILCEFLAFQPNVYDNNKLLYAGYFFCCFLSADAVTDWLGRRKDPRARGVLLTLLLIVSLNAGVLTILREVVSGIPRYGYELFSRDEVAAAEYIRENTEPSSLFLTDDNHDNAVAVLTGRNILCGSPSYLYYHGLDYAPYQKMAERMFTDPAAFEEYRLSCGVDYVYVGYYERSTPGLIESYYRENYPVAFSSGGIVIYDVR